MFVNWPLEEDHAALDDWLQLSAGRDPVSSLSTRPGPRAPWSLQGGGNWSSPYNLELSSLSSVPVQVTSSGIFGDPPSAGKPVVPDAKASAARKEDTLPVIPGLAPEVTLEVRNFVATGEGDEDENVPNCFVSETVLGRRKDWATRSCPYQGFRQCALHTATSKKCWRCSANVCFWGCWPLQRVDV